MQKAIFVRHTESNTDLFELTSRLNDGWKVIHSCPLPSSGSQYGSDSQDPICLLILEKIENLPV